MREKLPAQGLEPQDAYDRLKEFLELLGIAVEPELEEPEPEGENAFRPVRAGCFTLVGGISIHIPHTYNKGCGK